MQTMTSEIYLEIMEEELLYQCMEAIHEDQGWNLKQPKQYKALLVLYTGVDYEGLNSVVTTTIYHTTRHIGCSRRYKHHAYTVFTVHRW
jgi:hypothetical protein